MALFVISCLDKEGGLPLRMATREAHLAYIAAHREMVKLAGPFLVEGEMAGSMLVVEAETLAEVEAFANGDPYKLAGLFETTFVRAWKVTLGSVT
ncbi:MAG: YciI family protein [Caulobacteraceae bacterium]|nr:MAG: YciI family protein [Caulobacteraceae bacterium]